MDVTPVEFIDLTKISFVGSGKDLAMTGSTIEAVDDVHFTFQMLEITRVEGILNSNTPGGDGSAQTLTLLAGAIRDIGTNLLPVDNTLITLTEIADTGKPVITEVRRRKKRD